MKNRDSFMASAPSFHPISILESPMHRHVFRITLLAGAFLTTACIENAPIAPTGAETMSAASTNAASLLSPGQQRKSYLINFIGTEIPANLAAQVAAAGGTLTSSLDRIGVAIVSSSDPAFAERAAQISGVEGVGEDVEVQWVKPERFVEAGDATEAGVEPNATFGSAETFRQIQWAPDAIHAPEAWDLGQRGAGVRVAVLDGGIHSTQIDIAPRLDVARSRSFVPDTAHPGTFRPFNTDSASRWKKLSATDSVFVCDIPDTFWHGTHVAGIIAAPATEGTPFPNLGTVGIAPSATIIGVKVLHCGSGSFSSVISGIYYAATPIAEGGAGADIINMSLGATFKKNSLSAVQLIKAMDRATTYAYSRGVTVVASMGNDAANVKGSIVSLPATSAHVIAVSATGPLGFALGATDFDRPASYTNYGHEAVSFAGPGGDFALPGNAICQFQTNPPRTPTPLQFCWVLDMVMAPCRGGLTSTGSYCWAAGTSMASPAVAGVAALIIGKYGRVGPDEIKRRLQESADDLGKKGKDDFYGGGRVNALRAVQ
jgi:lantibiotic leader peptide-processing serine protease